MAASATTTVEETAPASTAAPTGQKTDQEMLAEFIKGQQELKEAITLQAKKAAGEAVKESSAELAERIIKLEAGQAALVQKQTVLAQRQSRPPGGGGPDDGFQLSLGQSFTQSDAFKNASWTGKFKIQHSHRGPLELRNTGGTPTPLVTPPTVTEGGSGLVIYPRRVAWVPPPAYPLVMRDLLDVIPLSGTNAVEYVKETWTENPDYQVTEGTRKAQSGVAYTDATAMVRTIAHFLKISTQMLADVPQVQASIDQRMVYAVLRKEATEILYGDNSAGHLWGLMPQSTALVIAAGITATTTMDAILAAITQVANNGYMPTAIVVNPTDWAAIQLAKTTQGNYILQGPGYGLPQGTAAQLLWGLPVMASISMKAGEFLVGAFPGNAALFDRQQAIVEISFENEDDFVNNLATIRCEERIAFACYVPKAFVWGNTASPFVPTGAPLEAGDKGRGVVPPSEEHTRKR